MPLLAELFQVFILITCLIGMGLVGKLAWPEAPFSLHFCFAPLALIAVLFCLEHFLPLGQMPWLWVPGSALSLLLIRRAGWNLGKEPVLWYFLIGFAVCFFWRFSFPDIYPISEMIPDNAHLVSYSAGGRLPAEDVWMKGSKDDSYYILQYYAAGLIHRWMGCGPGLTYQLGYCALVGIGIAATGAGVQAATRSGRAGVLASVCLALGGDGATFADPVHEPPFQPVAACGHAVYRQLCRFRSDDALWDVGAATYRGQQGSDAPHRVLLLHYHAGRFPPPPSAAWPSSD